MAEKPLHPGILLKKRFLDPLGITPYALAKAIGVHVRRVSELVKGNRSLTPDTAHRLSLYFDVPAVWWLKMQAEYDAAAVEDLKSLRQLVQPCEHLDDVLISPKGVTHLSKGKDSTTAPVAASASKEFLEHLRSQVGPQRSQSPRQLRTVRYSNGSVALVGDPK